MSAFESSRTPTQAEMDKLIAQAHRMRGEHVAHMVASGVAFVRRLFVRKGSAKAASA